MNSPFIFYKNHGKTLSKVEGQKSLCDRLDLSGADPVVDGRSLVGQIDLDHLQVLPLPRRLRFPVSLRR